MAVTKLPRTRKGTLAQGPPLSWPNDTRIGPRRPRLELLRQATQTRRQHRFSELSASSRHNVPKPNQHLSLRSQALRASDSSRYKAHKRTHHSRQQPKTQRTSGNPPKQNGNLAVHKPPSHAMQPPNSSQASSTSLTKKKQDANPQNDKKIKATPKSINWPAYERAKALRLKNIRIWVYALRQSHRIVDSVAKELMAYYGSEKYGNHPSARTLSRHAWQAVKLCEHEFGTDLKWGKGLGEAVWGSEHGKVEALIQVMMEGDGEGTPGVGTVGESDLSEFEDEGEEDDDGDDEAFWGDGVGKDVEMAEAA